MPLFRRPDGELVKDIDPIRRMMPMLMRGRNEAIIYHTTQWKIANARAWLRNYNRKRGSAAHASLFHLVAHSCAKILHERPGINRFVSGGSIYQRSGVWLSFAAKTQFHDEAPLTTVKLKFEKNQFFDESVDRITGAVKDGRYGPENFTDREVRVLTKLPGPMLRALIAAGGWLDRFNLLPGAMIERDPMYTSMFLANLGSIHIANAYHHLYEYGTCSLFGVVGAVTKAAVADRKGQLEACEVLHGQWSFDERVNDGFYCMEALETMSRIMENPQRYIACSAEDALAAGQEPLLHAGVE